ncbi:MAG: eukaryotic-like serine/threonine-protein kinase [Pseudonocardiales bacterium]|nr:eukaryotic-like serine/threonine-protein kinase [Pseudonocardiales bacterium]
MPGYRIEELLGSGSSGEVWRARVNSSGVAVALKRIWLSDPAQRKAALSEAAMLSSLDHPHLMKLHELRHVDDDAIVLVLDLAGGGSLASLLARRGRLTVGEAITAIAPIGAALAYAHHSGVVHGDVSSANILFTDNGLPLLADLGVARLLGDAAPVRTTPAYADPAVAGGALPGPASDVFMLGAVALHVLTGSPPWLGTDPARVLEDAACGEQPDFDRRLARAGVPESVAGVVGRALSVEPTLRAAAADFALDLRHSGDPVAVELSAGRPSPVTVAAPGGRADSWPLQSVPAAASPSAPAGRAVAFVGEQPLTHGVRAPSPFISPPSARHLARSRPRVTTGLAVAAMLLALVAATAVWWWPSGGGGDRERAPAGGASSVARLSSTAPTEPSRLDATEARAVLAGLDATRSSAFAHRDPSALVSVYASPALLARDQALLTAIVPSGCGLRGVHTDFRRVVVTARTADRVSLRTRSELASSTLVCGGSATGRAAGSAARMVQIDLVRRGSAYRIAAQRRL